ncbi:glycosyltransferase [Paenibacillus sp. PK4536]|uniref:1,2-diacylglycerol 3-glucosyltransferase n=1 Tax=Paenibacillus nuruki TaxID=1886670 RepID=A0A1E3L769_9BACL|nr:MULTISPECIES: glycosyltransferase [Paenibacillus]ODP29608.1 1,2-diacylglycerol 3-glucosyltransferase [Paenibacillus nuruki]WIM40232.1 glycosyltransferase [Paenibacillus sp. PK4536]
MSDAILLISIMSIWIAVFESIVIMWGAIRFMFKQNKIPTVIPENMDHFPSVTVIVPAHNEEIVIISTVEHILKLNYPPEKVQIIIVADNCSDNTASRLRELKDKPPYRDRDFTIMERTGSGGKSGALNDAMVISKGEWLCVYDADAAPEKNALLFLTQKAMEQPEKYGAVFGRNKARNRSQNFLSGCINLELITIQRVHHTGMWELFGLGTIPGTNFIVRKDLMEEIGGWDPQAITEDTAISFEILTRGKLIALAPQAEAYQQEPELLSVYMKQRERWSKGNYSVVMDNIHHLFDKTSWRIKLHVMYYAASYFWFMIAIIVSDIIFLANIVYQIIELFNPAVISPFQFVGDVYVYLVIGWALMYYIYVLQINMALATDIGQSNTRNFILSCVSYFTYSQLFLIISVKAFFSITYDRITGRESKWYKTKRFG